MTELQTRAREMLDARMAALGGIEQSQEALSTARAAVRKAEHDQAAAYAAALSAGWTETELRKLGVDAPAPRRPGRPKGGRTSTKRQRDQAREGD